MVQVFDMTEFSQPFETLKIEFPGSTDFFGRIVVYDLKLIQG